MAQKHVDPDSDPEHCVRQFLYTTGDLFSLPDPDSDPEHCVRRFLFTRRDLFSLPARAETAKVATCWSRDTGSESEAAGSSSEE
jgi:hypothetical protein